MQYTTLNNTEITEIRSALQPLLVSEHLCANEPMSSHTTFRAGGAAALFVTPDEAELAAVMGVLQARDIKPLVIGNGSNLLVSDSGIDGVVILIGDQMAQIEADAVVGTVRAQAGARLGAVARKAAEAGLGGMEFASGIPGSIGGAVMMNAGAYGGEMKDVVASVTYIPLKGEDAPATVPADGRTASPVTSADETAATGDCVPITSPAKDISFSYRHSSFMDMDAVITEVVLQLEKGDPEAIRAKMKELNAKRVEKQPLEHPSAGSTFKRPEGWFAGKLIEDAGLKGFRVGGACVSEKHAGFVVNDRGASAADIYQVIRHVQEEVLRQFGVTLETEVRIIGSFE